MLLFTSCATYDNVDRELIPYVKQFNEHYNKYSNKEVPSDIYIKFNPISESKTALGVYNTATNRTYIQTYKWKKLNEAQREILIFHELGHHLLKRFHHYHLQPDGCAKSIMFYMLFSDKCYTNNKEKYLEELFLGKDEE